MSLRRVRDILRTQGGYEVGERGRISIRVPLGNRSHRVQVVKAEGWIRIRARAARIGRVVDKRSPAQVLEQTLQLNGVLELAGVSREDDWLTVHADVPSAVAPAELLKAVLRVARTADRLELLWEGSDGL